MHIHLHEHTIPLFLFAHGSDGRWVKSTLITYVLVIPLVKDKIWYLLGNMQYSAICVATQVQLVYKRNKDGDRGIVLSMYI
jgi:hypothetical protein